MPPSSPYARAIASCAISAPKFSSSRATSFAVNDISANDVALVEENLGAEIAHEAIARAYGDEGGIPRVLHHGPGTTLQVNDGKVAICVHFVAGGVERGLRQVGARELAHGFHTTRQRKVADRHVGIIGKRQKGPELLEESVFGVGIGGTPACGRKRVLDLFLRADEKQVNYVRIFTASGGGAV